MGREVMSATEANRTAVALLTAAGLDDNAQTFTKILREQSVGELEEVVIALAGGYRGVIRALASAIDADPDQLLEATLAGIGAAWAGETS
jgi:hypothetical protein